MKKINFWDFKLDVLDNLFFEAINCVLKLQYYLSKKKIDLIRNVELKNKHIGKRCFLVGNGPSIKEQNLKLLKDEITFFVNKAFLHSDYEYIKPTYHVFVDPKLARGQWPVTFLDQVAEKNPDVSFLLNAKWSDLSTFQEYKKKYNIYWIHTNLFFTPFFNGAIDLTTICVGAAVIEQALINALYMGIKEIYITGVDGNGLCYNLIGKDSHFYGYSEEDISNDLKVISKSLYFMSTSLRRWVAIASYCQNKGIKVVNLTKGGILHCFQRQHYEDIVENKM